MPKIILVEDNRILKIAQERLLARAGYSVIYAGDGEEALRLAMPEQPDLILLDMMLPKLSGPEVLRRLKSDPATAHIPVIVVTSLSQKNEEKLKEAGAAAFLTGALRAGAAAFFAGAFFFAGAAARFEGAALFVGALFGMLVLILRAFPGERRICFDFLDPRQAHYELAAVGAVFYLGVWADKAVFWLNPGTSAPVITRSR